VTLVFVGFCTVSMLTTANGYVQTMTDPALRGRVLALYMAILMGATPVGAPIIGWVATEFGPRTAIQVGAVAGLLACAIGATWMLSSGRLHRHETKRFRLTLDETVPIRVVDAPEEYSDEVAGTTPIPLPSAAERDAAAPSSCPAGAASRA
jgi:MFS family permease